MANVFMIHGSYGRPEENWFPWLKKELEELGHRVFVPKFPTPANQSLESWTKIFRDYEKYIDNDSIFIGHSLGSAFILSVLEEYKIRTCFFVSGFLSLLGNPIFDKVNRTFVEKKFDWQKIKEHCDKFYVFHSDNDSYVPFNEAEKFAKALGTKVMIVKGAGHFNKDAGYLKFDILLEMIKKELASI